MTGLSTGASGLWGGNPGLLFTTGLSTGTGLLANLVPSWVLPGAVLDLYFANSLGFNSAKPNQTTPDSILTYTNPSAKMVYGSDGVLRYAPHNLLLQSQTQTGPGWGFDASTGSGLTLDGGLGPDGANQLCTFNEGTSTGAHRANRSLAIVAATAYTFSTYLRAGTSRYIAFGSNRGGIAIDTVNWSITQTIAPANTTVTNGSLTQVADGLYLASVTVSHTTDTTTFFVVSTAVTATPGTMTPSFAGTSRTAIFGFCQISLGSSALTYIPTTTAAVYSLPIDHNPTTFASLGVLVEEQRVNLLTYSQQFDTTWAKAQATVTANSTVAPDGTTTADTLLDTAVSNIHYINQTVTGSPSGVTYTVSAYLKASTLGYATLGLSDISSGSLYAVAVFNLSSGTVATSGAAGTGYSVTSSSITSVGNGWYRCVATVVAGTSVAFLKTVVGCNKTGVITGSAGGFESYLGNGSGVFVWGAQLEAGAFATSYIPTVASQVTRAADQVSILTSAFGFNHTAGTWVATFDIASGYTANYRVIDSGNAYRWLYGPINVNTLSTYNGSVALGTTIASPVGLALTGAVGYDATSRSITAEGDAVSTDASVYGTASTVLHLGSNAGTANHLNGHIKRLTYFPTRRTNADLQGLTT